MKTNHTIDLVVSFANGSTQYISQDEILETLKKRSQIKQEKLLREE